MEECKAVYKKPWLWIAAGTALAAAVMVIFFAVIPAVNRAGGGVKSEDETYGDYIFKEQIYMNLLSSILALEGYVEYYTLTENTLTITDAAGTQRTTQIGYDLSEVNEQDFCSMFMMEFERPDISSYKQRYKYTLCEPSDYSPGYELYLMDDEVWLARLSSGESGQRYLWSIYRIERYGGELPEADQELELTAPYSGLIWGNPIENFFDESHIDTLTVVSGENSIDVEGHVFCTQSSYLSYFDDSKRLTPRQAAKSIQYLPIEIDQNTYVPFIPLINGKEAEGNYIVYDMSFNEVPTFLYVSSRSYREGIFWLAEWPGKYIVEFEVTFPKDYMTTYSQYFFGVILPEKPEG